MQLCNHDKEEIKNLLKWKEMYNGGKLMNIDNKIEIGEYVRTNQGHIGVLKRIELDKNDKGLKWYVFDKKEFEINIVKEEYINKPYIAKHSKNIIDIIEVGDYVNGEKVTDIDLTYFNGNDRLKEPKRIGVILGNDKMFKFSYHIKKEDIKSIVTKEQFKNIKYEVE